MTPTAAFKRRPAQIETRRTVAAEDHTGGCNVLCALIEALSSPATHRIVERAGELFIEPAMPVTALAA